MMLELAMDRGEDQYKLEGRRIKGEGIDAFEINYTFRGLLLANPGQDTCKVRMVQIFEGCEEALRPERRVYYWGKSSADGFTLAGFYGNKKDQSDPEASWEVILNDEIDRRAEAGKAALIAAEEE